QLNTINIKSVKFTWTTSFNISIPNNKLISYPNIESSPYANSYTVGQSLYTKKYFHFLGIDPKTGLSNFQDYNNNGSGINYPADLQYLVKKAQNFYGGFQNSFSYDGFQLDIFFQFVNQTGSSFINSQEFGIPGGETNQPVEVLGRWQKPGDQASYQKFSTGSGTGFPVYLNYLFGAVYGSNSVTDASFVRLKNVSLTYSVPQSILKKLKISALSFYLQGQNLFTITSYVGLDPENNQSTSVLPALRIITGGLKLIL
ncbi:MAG TPA: hypothetical protein VNX68_03705, partial [Nitrosopumilaceae archaeon]|nr:hypothetical protein [Nitrosopumilaceae archaeon]